MDQDHWLILYLISISMIENQIKTNFVFLLHKMVYTVQLFVHLQLNLFV
jgi:hypothetical protein